jgi:hypothetical protein
MVVGTVGEALTIRATNGTSFDAPSLADTSAPDTRFTYTPQRTAANTNVQMAITR